MSNCTILWTVEFGCIQQYYSFVSWINRHQYHLEQKCVSLISFLMIKVERNGASEYFYKTSYYKNMVWIVLGHILFILLKLGRFVKQNSPLLRSVDYSSFWCLGCDTALKRNKTVIVELQWRTGLSLSAGHSHKHNFDAINIAGMFREFLYLTKKCSKKIKL